LIKMFSPHRLAA